MTAMTWEMKKGIWIDFFFFAEMQTLVEYELRFGGLSLYSCIRIVRKFISMKN